LSVETGIAFILAAVVVALLALAVRNWIRGAASRDWPQVEAEIVRAFVLVDTSTETDTYTPNVEYDYQVAGASHRGTRLRYGALGSSNRGPAERTIASYPVGSRHLVFVNPENPKDAVLQRGTSWTNLVIAIFGCVFAGAGVLLYLHGT
jgi:hypothetical protein